MVGSCGKIHTCETHQGSVSIRNIERAFGEKNYNISANSAFSSRARATPNMDSYEVHSIREKILGITLLDRYFYIELIVIHDDIASIFS